MRPIRVVVVDDHALFRSGLISLLGEMPEFMVVGEANNGEEALEVVRRERPDVVLLDINMPVMGGVETVKAIRDNLDCHIIMLTISKSDEDLFGAIMAGADGYLLKNASPDELRKGVLQVHEGMAVLSPDVTRQVLKVINVDSSRIPLCGLSSRELEVLECLAQGMTTGQVAGQLFISENTVKTHVRHILEKLEAANRAEAVRKAIQLGLIKS
jgi:DNA-binding NarL/FixJ family response regulator